MKYAGIGSRKTPQDILGVMASVAEQLADLGWTLRSGAADGADTAFETGAKEKEIYLPWEGYNGRSIMEKGVYAGASQAACELALKYHPAPDKLSQGALKLHGRNSTILLGLQLDEPVDMVICWTEGGKISGGTGQALRLAIDLKIPTFNLAVKSDYDKLDSFVESFLTKEKR